MEKSDSVKKLCEASLRVDTSLLKMLAEADVRGRICEDKNGLLEAVELFEIFCREQDCWSKPREFVTDYARFITSMQKAVILIISLTNSLNVK